MSEHTSEHPGGARVHARGRVRDLALDALVEAWLDGDRLLLTWGVDAEPAALPLSACVGLRTAGDELALLQTDGGLLTLTAEEDPAALRALAEALRTRAYALPEVTRALRAYGSRRGNPGSDHDRFFAPLVGPLRAARDQVARGDAEPWRAESMADGAAMTAALHEVLSALAADRFPKQPPERRALEAELHELAEPVTEALARLSERAAALRDAADDERLLRWRAWAAALGDVFARADRAWIAALPALVDPRGGSGRLWRRVLRREG